jgi:hypothetical protein
MEVNHSYFRFYVFAEAKRGVSASEVLKQLRVSFGDAAPSQAFVYKWLKEYTTTECQSFNPLPRSGRPISQRTEGNISRVYDYLEINPKSSLRCIGESLLLSKDTVHRIITDDLLFRKVCSVWVPHHLTNANKVQRPLQT